ncbi:Na/Pi cotransporter family protein [Halomonas campisalis]|uniref:Na/Pi cotransporter family protein n=1 Tax=Billgrantia campisalis TaxID=74661 RepID=A0ABS9PAX1_9GAMM|nr:Na/Pi symporter [Halomonas campisalis]MCG6658903.1 Na/Pi cotransporter family protein [Halomonas campisalis]MDR5864797.1 Na/Pi symporter [Halomonas campisalis]
MTRQGAAERQRSTRRRLELLGLAALAALLLARLDLATLAAGIGLFLWGMSHLEEGIKRLSGGTLDRWLHNATRSPARAIGVGALATALVQSSSLVTLLAMSFVSAGLVSLTGAIALLFGANLGTTTGAWLIAGFGLRFDLAQYAMPLLAVGLLGRYRLSGGLAGLAGLLLGIGLLFLGIDFMKLGFDAWQDGLHMAGLSGERLWHWPLFVAFGIIATVVMQSSHATLLITLTALASGQLAYLPALAIAIGANIGTTITAVLGALAAGVAARRLAGAHVVFNLFTAAVALVLLMPLASLVDLIAELIGLAEGAWPLKLALFHTLFNLLGIALMLPLIPRLTAALEQRITEPARQVPAQARYLDVTALAHADTAVTAMEQECQRLNRRAYHLLCTAILMPSAEVIGHPPEASVVRAPIRADDWPSVNARYHERIKPLLAEILDFRARIDAPLTDSQQSHLDALYAHTLRMVEAVRFGELLQRSLLRHAARTSPLRDAHDDLRLGLAEGLNRLAADPSTQDIAAPLEAVRRHWQHELAERLRQQRLTAWPASTLMNDLHQASRLIAALSDPPNSD